ncbi:uncharacterized protein LOC110618493 [Manihot esculenta]|uniref:Uncharacterized protein n=1 Tax=Manihot esculenta TaxID=3983 RepID=A0A2C9VHD6_MANES|nr:uncharacterized protein LOC110618493 [Manihot esculenta]OAY44799.1 hypothetical protein MANES_07G006300v8 [Manihot esculenta]
MAVTEEPILSRLDRLDNMLRELEEIRGSCNRSPKSSFESTPSSGTRTSEGQISSIDYNSPRSTLEKHCRPINRVIMETETKGTLVERLDHVEERLLKLCIQLEEELEAEKKREEKSEKREKKGLKGIMKTMVNKGKKNPNKAKE